MYSIESEKSQTLHSLLSYTGTKSIQALSLLPLIRSCHTYKVVMEALQWIRSVIRKRSWNIITVLRTNFWRKQEEKVAVYHPCSCHLASRVCCYLLSASESTQTLLLKLWPLDASIFERTVFKITLALISHNLKLIFPRQKKRNEFLPLKKQQGPPFNWAGVRTSCKSENLGPHEKPILKQTADVV